MRQRAKPASPQAPVAAEGTPKTKSKFLFAASDAVTRGSPYISENDFVDFLYKPHTVFGMCVLLGTLYALWKWSALPGGDMDSSIKAGLAAAAWAFVVFGTIHLPDGVMVRPHPLFWRFVLSIAVLYMLLIIFLIFQDLKTVKKLTVWYDPVHAITWPEQSYGDDCRMSTPESPYKFWYTIGDIFLLAHSMGYCVKMLVVRDWRLVTAISVGFEILEVTFQHQLPNFTECWWDHVIVDILICNGGGTLIGCLVLKLIGAKPYHWVKLTDIPSMSGKAGRVLKQFTPRYVEHFHWHMFASFKRFAHVMLILCIFFLNEVNCFTMKNILNQKATYHLVASRIVFWGFLAVPSVREYYTYISDPTVKRIGTFCWVGGVALLVETIFINKMIYEGNYFTHPTPAVIGVCWSLAGAMFILWTTLFFGLRCLQRWWITRQCLNVLFYGSFAVLAVMCCMANVDTQWKLEEFNAFIHKYRLW